MTSVVELTPNSISEIAGLQPTKLDQEAVRVLSHAHFNSFTTKSDFARKHADIVAMLACCELITTEIGLNNWSNIWKVTASGLQLLQDLLYENSETAD